MGPHIRTIKQILGMGKVNSEEIASGNSFAMKQTSVSKYACVTALKEMSGKVRLDSCIVNRDNGGSMK